MLKDTGYVRKLDSTGRIVIPTKIKERMGMKTGVEYPFYTMETEDGKSFICIQCPGVNEDMLEEARRLIKKYGLG